MSRITPPLSRSFSDISTAWPWLPYVAPFGVFAALTTLLPMMSIGAGVGYTAKTLATAAILAIFWPMLRQEIQWAWDWLAVAAGIGVFVVWIGLEGRYPQIGHSSFDPYAAAGPWNATGIISVRLFGAAMVVPLMEELFWRSFVMRFLVASRFKSVLLGQFSWYAFVITAVAFGFEHHRWLPGIIAGIVYGALLCRSRNLFSPILAHTVTNLLLGIYVLQTEQWSFW